MTQELNNSDFQAIFLGNSVEILYERLRDTMFSSEKNIFTRRVVVVPGQALQSWLTLKFARDPALSIAAGVEFKLLEDGLASLKKGVTRIPGTLELSLAIETKILRAIKNPLGHHERWNPVFRYLKISGGAEALSPRIHRRLSAMCQHMATLFDKYGSYAEDMVAEWESCPGMGWQAELWHAIFCEGSGVGGSSWSYPYREVRDFDPDCLKTKDAEVHLFGFSFIPAVYNIFFASLSEHLPVCYYILSPCRLFWSDIRSKCEIRNTQKHHHVLGVSESEPEALENYLMDTNLLLANFGRLGCECARFVEDHSQHAVECYCLPRSVAEHPYYADSVPSDTIVKDAGSSAPTILEALQADMMLLRNPGLRESIAFSSSDESIQVHAATSRMREVQVIHNAILGMAKDGVHPEDVLVMSPCINDYIPYVKAVFGDEGSPISYHLMDLGDSGQSHLIEAFLFLIDLSSSRWDPDAILQLLEYPSFQRRHGISDSDVVVVMKWIREINIRWGADSKHRDEFISSHYDGKIMVAKSFVATWEYGINMLLSGISMVYDPAGPLQYVDVEPSCAELIGKVRYILGSLRDDLRPLTDGTVFSPEEWGIYLSSLFDAYFLVDADDKKMADDYAIISKAFTTIRQASKSLPEEKFSFVPIYRHLKSFLSQHSIKPLDRSMHSVTFCSIMPMRAVPSEVICLIGMDEGVFPRQDVGDTLDVAASHVGVDYFPARSRLDRHLFLDTILSARRSLIMSYQGYSFSDSHALPPSLLVSELLDYINNSYDFSMTITRHPQQSYQHGYFDGTGLKNFAYGDYKLAKAYYSQKKSPKPQLISQLSHSPSVPSEEPVVIDIKDLVQTARNPLKTYFNKTLGIYLREDESFDDAEEFSVGALELYMMKMRSLSLPIDDIISHADTLGKLPLGIFRDVAVDNIHKDSEALNDNLRFMGLAGEVPWNIILDLDCDTAEQVAETRWRAPAIKVDDVLTITGMLNNVTSEGLLHYGGNTLADVVKVWPAFLAFSCLQGLPVKKNLLLMKTGTTKKPFFDDARPLLKIFSAYHFACLADCCPLIPEWLPEMFKNSPETFQKKINATITAPRNRQFNDYLRKAFPSEQSICAEELLSLWHNYANETFGGLVSGWFPKTVRAS